MSDQKFKISSELFQQKRYEVAKDILASVMNRESLDADPKQRENILYHCIQFADEFMGDIGYFADHQALPLVKSETKIPEKLPSSESNIHKIKDILKSSEDED